MPKDNNHDLLSALLELSDLDKAKLCLVILKSISDPIAFEVDEAKKSVSAVISYFRG